MTTATAPRTPKRKDYGRVALDAAQASLAKQTAAHVEVLKAADLVADAEAAVEAAEQTRQAAVATYNQSVYELVEMLGIAEASTRLESDIKTVRAAHRAGASQPDGATGAQVVTDQ